MCERVTERVCERERACECDVKVVLQVSASFYMLCTSAQVQCAGVSSATHLNTLQHAWWCAGKVMSSSLASFYMSYYSTKVILHTTHTNTLQHVWRCAGNVMLISLASFYILCACVQLQCVGVSTATHLNTLQHAWLCAGKVMSSSLAGIVQYATCSIENVSQYVAMCCSTTQAVTDSTASGHIYMTRTTSMQVQCRKSDR